VDLRRVRKADGIGIEEARGLSRAFELALGETQMSRHTAS